MPQDPEIEPDAPVPTTGPGRKRLLTSERIGAAAFALLDDEGPDALTMARLAKRLGVSPMTLYGYADSKDAIIAMLPELLLDGVPEPDPTLSWRDAMEEVFTALYARFVDHAAVASVVFASAVFGPSQARILEGVLACLDRAGFSKSHAFVLQRTLATYTVGFAQFVIAERLPASPLSRTNWVETTGATQFPHLAQTSSLLGATADDGQFRLGLQLILGQAPDTDTSSSRVRRRRPQPRSQGQ